MKGTVLIADDEMIVRKTLMKMIAVNETGWKVVGEAENGEEVLRLADQYRPDLIIADVKMPKLNGIALAERLHAAHKGIQFIMLTGYKEFEYVQRALKFGAVDFLLKPCSEDELCRALAKAFEAVTERRIVEENVIRSLCYGLPVQPEWMHMIEERYRTGSLALVRINVGSTTRNAEGSDRHLLQFALYSIIEELLGEWSSQARIVFLHNDLCLLLVGEDMVPMAFRDLLRTAAAAIHDKLEVEWQTEYISKANELALLPGRLVQLKGEAEKGVTTADAVVPNEMIAAAQQHNFPEMLMPFVLVGDTEGMRRATHERVMSLRSLSCAKAKVEAMAIAVAFHDLFRKQLTDLQESVQIKTLLTQLYGLTRTEDVVQWIAGQFDDYIAEFSRWSEERKNTALQQAISYMEVCYRERCSLQDVAARVHLNPKYFSRVFKQGTGVNFVSFLTNIRLEKAALLLANTDMRVTEVATEVGFDNSNYLTTLFTKKYGTSPKEYRKTSGYIGERGSQI